VSVRISRDPEGRQVNEWIWGPLPKGSQTGRGKDAAGDAAYAKALKGLRLITTHDELAAVFWDKRKWVIAVSEIAQTGHVVRSPLTFDSGDDG
jgi:hypothetical protein